MFVLTKKSGKQHTVFEMYSKAVRQSVKLLKDIYDLIYKIATNKFWVERLKENEKLNLRVSPQLLPNILETLKGELKNFQVVGS